MIKGTGLLREKNKRTLLSHVRKLGETSRQELVKLMNVSKNTVSLIVEDMIKENILVEKGIKEPGRKGRPRIRIQINRDNFLAVGFSVSKYNLHYIVVNYYGEQVEQNTFTVDGSSSDLVVAMIYDIAENLIQRYKTLIGIGIGIPGIVDVDRKIVLTSTPLNWRDVTFTKFEQIGVPVHLHNSVNMGALDAINRNGFTEGEETFYVRIGEGVGGAYIYENDILNGASWTAGEIGHLSIEATTERCRCGQFGCLEMLINHVSFLDKLQHTEYRIPKARENITFAEELLHSGQIQKIVEQYGCYLGKAIVQIIHIINPKYILIDSSYNAFPQFVDACSKTVRQNALEASIQNMTITYEKKRSQLYRGAALYSILHYEQLFDH
ncbi:ROK family protein [Sporosarcina koreensis]|uniref:ROK family protein n=1 Tax=Sporosarcina koreensis TaxID=334735 RepID=UPI0007574DD6|nr:ROK family protein [Sporosarcina koreensis]